jgi:DNA adenine methylase
MQYFGGKFRVRKQISQFINLFNPSTYLEPFCGSAWVAELVKADVRICCDLNSDLIALWQAVQSGWEPPDNVTQEEYYAAKDLVSPNPLKAFCGFGCSFAGKYFGGYARGGHGADAKTAKSQLTKRMYAKTAKSQGMEDVVFSCLSYEEALTTFYADLVYCDPPYQGTTKFYGLPDFDTGKFWEVVRRHSRHTVVLVSEYEAPADFMEVLSIPTRTDIRSAEGKLIPRCEKLFRWAG